MRRERRLLPGVAWALLSLGVTAVVGSAGQPATPGAGEISFAGRVLDSQDRPVADANVVFYEVGYDASGTSPVARQVKNAITGADGAFAFTAPRVQEVYRQGSIIARKEGLALGWAVWNMREEENKQSDIRLDEPKELAGTVVDESDSPVADAEVSLAIGSIGVDPDRPYLTYLVAPKLMTVRTDSAGRFAIPDLPAGATFELVARKAGRATVCSFDADSNRGEGYHFSPGQAGIKLTLPVEARLEGKVLEKTGGKPLPGVQLVAQPDLRSLPFTIQFVTSAADGSFSIGNLPAGGYTVQLPQGAKTAEWVAEPVKLNLKAGEAVRDVRLALSKGGILEVLVKEESSGKPIEKASVSVRGEAQESWLSGATDANGVARIRLAAGNYLLGAIYKQDYARSEQGETPFAVAEGQTLRLEQTLGGFPTVGGVVYDDVGKPLEGAVIQVVPGGGSKNAVSDAQGKFQANWDSRNWPSERMVFYVVARHLERGLAVAGPLDQESRRVEMKLRPATVLTGRVVDPNGKGIPGAQLIVMLHASTWSSSILPHRSVTTDAEGWFETPVLPADQQYDVIASAEGYGQERIRIDADRTAAGKGQAGTFTLPFASLSVTGAVVDSAGKPVSGAQVSCHGGYEDNQPNRDTRTDAQGRFTLARVCPGRIDISSYVQTGGTNLNGHIRTEGGAADIRIVLSDRSSSRAYAPRRPASLRGKRLPDLKKLGIELPTDANDRMLLVCFWDLNQRPSRHCVGELIRRAAQLSEKGMTVVAIQAGQVEQAALDQWAQEQKPPFPTCRIASDIEKTQFEWGVASLPHLILTDRKHIVIAEGFGLLGELDRRIDAASSQPGQ